MQTRGERIANAVVYMLIAIGGVLEASGVPKGMEGWIGMAVVAITAFWGKYSTSTRLMGPDRVVWPQEVRKVEAGK